MPQVLTVAEKLYDDDGFPVMNKETGKQETRLKRVTVIRSWQSASGKQIYQHSDGTYGYKDGSPVMGRDELEDPELGMSEIHRDLALAWWIRKGEKESKAFYEMRAAQRRRVAEATPGVVRQVDSDLDSVMYQKRPLNDRRRAAFGEPFTWFTEFKTRPDWWGHATVIDMGQWRYEMTDLRAEISKLDDQIVDAKIPGKDLDAPIVTGGDHSGSLDDAMDGTLGEAEGYGEDEE